jgi:hypothetical protein
MTLLVVQHLCGLMKRDAVVLTTPTVAGWDTHLRLAA